MRRGQLFRCDLNNHYYVCVMPRDKLFARVFKYGFGHTLALSTSIPTLQLIGNNFLMRASAQPEDED